MRKKAALAGDASRYGDLARERMMARAAVESHELAPVRVPGIATDQIACLLVGRDSTRAPRHAHPPTLPTAARSGAARASTAPRCQAAEPSRAASALLCAACAAEADAQAHRAAQPTGRSRFSWDHSAANATVLSQVLSEQTNVSRRVRDDEPERGGG